MVAAERLNGGLLSYGSHEARNPFNEPAVRTKRTAGYESGMDDSPMYEDVPFNPEKNTLELQDVGLTSLYIADCLALAELAGVLGRAAEAEELAERARQFSEALDGLWVEERGYYLNYRTDLGRPGRATMNGCRATRSIRGAGSSGSWRLSRRGIWGRRRGTWGDLTLSGGSDVTTVLAHARKTVLGGIAIDNGIRNRPDLLGVR